MASPASLSLLAPTGFPLVAPGDDLPAIILTSLAANGIALQNGDVLVLAQKIVSKAEGRIVALSDVTPSPRALELAATVRKDARLVELILADSTDVLRAIPDVLIVTHRLGHVCANAGIDQSNVGGEDMALLLPLAPDATCAAIRTAIRAATGAETAVLIIDSIGRAWRTGTMGQAIGVSGMAGLLDLRQRPDLFGRPLKTSELGLADEAAAAASLLMGQASEGRPLVLLRGLPYAPREGSVAELIRPRAMDLFR